VQTLALWAPIVLGFRRRELPKWAALPCLIFWLAILVFIWLFLLGWARIVTGHYSPVEIAMTLAIGAACITGIVGSLRWRTAVNWLAALGTAVLFAVLQLLAFRISLIPCIATR
jgi:prepilin signal peptidase PulO-like enzyme (type II secretory pathway)